MRKILFTFRILIFLLLLIILTGNYNDRTVSAKQDDAKYILIINSYHQELIWTWEETQGITDTLFASGANINYAVENMDWKSYPTKQNLQYLYHYYKYKYQNRKIDLIIATDDAALKFTLKNRKELFSNAPVVFCGVNKEGADSITEGYDNLTGVIEVIDPSETIKLALHINPDLKNLYLLYDNTESGLSTGELVINKANELYPKLNIISMNNMPYEDVQSKVQQLGKDSIVLVASYSSDVNHEIMDMNYVVRDLSGWSRVPVYHLYNYAMGSGTIGGSVLSGIKEGESAASLALRVINGERADDIPYLIPRASRNVMDYEQMVRYGISTKDVPKGYEVINKPFSFYETYKALIFAVIAIIAGLVIFAAVLLFYLGRISRMKKNLADNHEELTQLYEELTASDLEMRQQYDKIIESNEIIRVSEEKLSYLAYHDALTGLPNKLSLYETAKEAFIPGGSSAALLFVDIDNFKNVNDTKGHAFGDQLIIEVSNKLTEILGRNDIIYRLGGDEFIIVLQNIDNESAQKTAHKILSNFSENFNINDNSLRVSVSIGIALFPDHGTTLEHLLKSADIAMYRVKESGKTNYMIYNNRLDEVFTERANIDKYMPQALDNHEFELYYQPQYDLKHKKITGFEALLRWHSSHLGEVSPLKFIPVAEDNRFIVTLGKWVLQSACEFIKRIHVMGYEGLTISVNVSIIQMIQDDFCDIVAQTIKNTGIDAEYLELEITETVLIESMDRIMQVLNQLNEWKVRIVLDDFGKGYSSLSYLKQLPISTLKVDKIFIDGIVSDEDMLTGQIVAFGRSMGMKIVAEGVETKQQVEYLEKHDCDMLQGYIFSRPKPEEEIIKFLDDEATQPLI